MAGNNSTDINQLGQLDTVTGADQLAFWSTNNARTRKASVSQLLDYFESTFTSPVFVKGQRRIGTGLGKSGLKTERQGEE